MNNSETIKKSERATKSFDLELQKQIDNINSSVWYISWSDKLKKIFCAVEIENDSIKVLDSELNTSQLSVKLEINIDDIKISRDGRNLVMIGSDKKLLVVGLSPNMILRQIELPMYLYSAFVFQDESCDSVWLNSDITGLFALDTKTKNISKFYSKAFSDTTRENFKITSKRTLLFGKTKSEAPGCLDLKHNFKFRVVVNKFRDKSVVSNLICKNESACVSGNESGELNISDLRSSKVSKCVVFEPDSSIIGLFAKNGFIGVGFSTGELLIVRDAFPFSILYCKKVNEEIYDVQITNNYIAVAGTSEDSIKFFKIPHATEIKKKQTE